MLRLRCSVRHWPGAAAPHPTISVMLMPQQSRHAQTYSPVRLPSISQREVEVSHVTLTSSNASGQPQALGPAMGQRESVFTDGVSITHHADGPPEYGGNGCYSRRWICDRVVTPGWATTPPASTYDG
jgi:hypothetical protein